MSGYTPHTDADIAGMLEVIGAPSIEALFAHVPESLRAKAGIALPAGLTEPELRARLKALAGQNAAAVDSAVFLGAGAYPHFIPTLVDQMLLRSEFATAYTPYQAEVSQGTLQAIFEFQTFAALLLGLEVANASMYDGASALAEAVLMARRVLPDRRVVWVARTLHPHYRATLATYLRGLGELELRDVPFLPDGRCDPDALRAGLGADSLCAVIGYPNVFGVLENVDAVASLMRDAGGLTITATPEPLALALVRSPGASGADIAVAEGQSFGLPVAYGGPGVGLFATRDRFVRSMPGRVVGETVDTQGRRGFVLTLATREQHIRRERATSNICTNQGLCSLAVTVYLSLLGRQGLKNLAQVNYRAAHAAAARLGTAGVPVAFTGPFFNEFVVRAPETVARWEALAGEGIVVGFPLGRWYPELADALVVCVTETHTDEQIDRLVRTLATPARHARTAELGMLLDEPLIFERGSKGRAGWPVTDRHTAPIDLPAELRREDDLEGLPEVGELEVLRHFVRLSQWNYSAATTLYPLGSCTMKYNPVVNEELVRLPGFAGVHPLVPDALAQGALELVVGLEAALAAVSGLDAVCLQPAAGAHGELLGMLLVRSYHIDHGNPRRRVLIPSSAHGTNPASAALCGYEVREVPTDARGLLSAAAVAAHMDESVAALMITNPNTLGLFEEEIEAIAATVHACGGLVYMDGANLNAIMGIAKPGDMGVDVMQFNLHKTFSTPHGGGGPGAGPVAVRRILADYLPVPRVVRRGDALAWSDDAPKSVGRMRSFYGNFGVLARAFAYITRLGGPGLEEVTRLAVLNANYLRARLRDTFYLPYATPSLHECVFSDRNLQEHHVTTLDVAKRLLDYGFYAPTIYFPLVVKGALMIEPTETETRETLDEFADALIRIAEEARSEPARVREAPHRTRVGRLDDTRAARRPVLRWRPRGA